MGCQCTKKENEAEITKEPTAIKEIAASKEINTTNPLEFTIVENKINTEKNAKAIILFTFFAQLGITLK